MMKMAKDMKTMTDVFKFPFTNAMTLMNPMNLLLPNPFLVWFSSPEEKRSVSPREDDALDALEMGAEYPYDGDDQGRSPLVEDWPVRAARGVIVELTECPALREVLDAVEDDAKRVEMVETTAEIIRVAASRAEAESEQDGGHGQGGEDDDG